MAHTLANRAIILTNDMTDGESTVPYGHLSTVDGGGKSSLLPRSFSVNNVGIQSPMNQLMLYIALYAKVSNIDSTSHKK